MAPRQAPVRRLNAVCADWSSTTASNPFARQTEFMCNCRSVGGVGDDQEVLIGEPIHHQVVDHSAVVVADQRVLGLPDGNLGRLAGQREVQRLGGLRPADHDLTHMGQVEQAGGSRAPRDVRRVRCHIFNGIAHPAKSVNVAPSSRCSSSSGEAGVRSAVMRKPPRGSAPASVWNASGGGHEQARFRSPCTPSIRRTGGQYLLSRRAATGYAAYCLLYGSTQSASVTCSAVCGA